MRKDTKRELSGKAQRYEQATEKYKLYQQKRDKLSQLDSILTGKSREVIVPKPGEFFVVNSGQQRQLTQAASFQHLPKGVEDLRYKKQDRLPPVGSVTMTSLQTELKRQQRDQIRTDPVQSPDRFKDTIKNKQDQILLNPIRTSMTTNIRNIVSSQDKGLLTASSRLLHAEVREQEQIQPLQRQETMTHSKSVSTLDLLRLQQKRSRYTEMQPTQGKHVFERVQSSSNFNQPSSSLTKSPQAKSPKVLRRPTSTVVMQEGDQTARVKEKLDIQNARKRDVVEGATHSYQIKTLHPVLSHRKQWKDGNGSTVKSGQQTVSRIKQQPVLVQYQQALINEQQSVSPFLTEANDVVDIINDLKVSQSVKALPRMLDPLKHPETQPTLKYSDSIQQLKTIQNQPEQQSQKFLRKGTSLYLKDLIDKQNQKSQNKSPLLSARETPRTEEKRVFLPVEAFDPLMDIENPEQIIQDYTDHASGMTFAHSKWNYPNGEAELRRCIVCSYIKQTDLYEIVWIHNQSIKKRVSRFNLVFDLEDKEMFEWRQAEAHRIREKAEILMKYHYAIETVVLPKTRVGRTGLHTSVPEPFLIDSVKTRITYLIATFRPYEQVIKSRVYKNPIAFFARTPAQRYDIRFFKMPVAYDNQEVVDQVLADLTKRGFNLNLLATLFSELNADFIRLHKQIWFDLQLPFDKDKYLAFRDVLPAEKFVPVQDQIIDETDRTSIIVIPARTVPFQELLKKMQFKLHQANPLKLEVLRMAHAAKHQLAKYRLVQMHFNQPVTKDELITKHKIARTEVAKLLQDNIFDCEYEVHKILQLKQQEIDRLNEEAQRQVTHNVRTFVAMTIPEDFMEDIKKLQKVLQFSFEATMRELFIATVESAMDQLKFCQNEIQESTGQEKGEIGESELIRMSRDAVLQQRMIRSKCFQLRVCLIFNSQSKEIQLSPSPDEFIGKIQASFDDGLAILTGIQCILFARLGPVHAQSENSQVFLPQEAYPHQSLNEIVTKLRSLFRVPEGLVNAASQFLDLLTDEDKKFKKKMRADELTVDNYREKVDEFKQARKKIETLMFEDELQLGPFVIEVASLRRKLLRRLDDFQEILFQCIKTKVLEQSHQLEQEVETILQIVEKKSWDNIEEVDQTRRFVLKIQDKFEMLTKITRQIQSKTDFLDANQSKLTEEQIDTMWKAFAKPQEILYVQGDCLERLDVFTVKYAEELKEMQISLSKKIRQIARDVEEIANFEELPKLEVEKRFKKCDDTENKLYEAKGLAEVCNRRETLFGQNRTDFSNLKKMQDSFSPHHELWQLAYDYFKNKSQWMEGPISDLDGEELPNQILEANRKLLRLMKGPFKEALYTKEVCNVLKGLYQDFRPYLPLVTGLKNPDFKIRHFEILKKTKEPPFEIEHDLSQSLAELERIGVMEMVDKITEISEIATKEKQLEHQLTKMRDEWKSVKLTLLLYGQSETWILQGVQPIWDLLDEHIQKTMLIASSPYAKFFLADVLFWKSTLVKVQEILEEWSKTQRGWCYLWPIFNSPDIQSQLPDVFTLFQSVDSKWKLIMQQTHTTPLVLECANQHKAQEQFEQLNENLERITKNLNEYLHSKQLKFPRFLFLSNDDLLHILSQTKEPVRVQDHLNKCFEGITRLEFMAGTDTIKGMYSGMGEYIEFDKAVEPWIVTQVRSGKGRVEEVREVRPIEHWLLEVEEMMRTSLRSSVLKGLLAFNEMSKQDWIFAFPQQTVLVLDQILWTQNLEYAIKQKSKDALQEAYQAEESKLQELVSLIQKQRASKIEVNTLETLIVTDVHSMDVSQTIMNQKVQSINDFEWISQLRHYRTSEENKGERKLEIRIQMINSSRLYGFEYQGNQTRLVITPLTDRCYRTLMGALQLNLGGAPEGPAGTGKTETTKDLAKALAKQCLVFNCSDQLDVKTMAKFFTGLACCGAWACFDEFNRIDMEVLSVIAAQILQIQTALMRKVPNAPFFFEDEKEKIMLNSQCAVFITMNPGYAGRSELPDNLKALFRPVAMMIPNYELIAEISLYSYGFKTARELSVKIVQSLRLSSEQLSTQSHYDYGMRAVKSIIMAAGVLKRMQPTLDEAQLVLRAITDCNVPKFINEDINLFDGIITDLFPSTDKSKQQYGDLNMMITQSIQSRNLQSNQEFETKTVQLFETVQVRHGLMLVGGAMGGKTQIANTLADALSRVSKKEFLKDKTDKSLSRLDNSKLGCPQVLIHRINPKSVSIGKLYGDFEKVSRDWQDGILATKVRNAASDKLGDTHWIMLDGPVDAVWIENLNTVLDDNKKLCLISGEIIKLTDQMKMMFEVEDLQEASPATVSRCGMVYVSPDKVGWQVQTRSWTSQLPSELKQHGIDHMYTDMIDALVPHVVNFLFGKNQSSEEDLRLQALKPIVQVSKNWQFRSFLNLFEALLLNKNTKVQLIEKQRQNEQLQEGTKKFQADEEPETARKEEPARKVAEYYDVLEPSDLNHVIQAFIMALTWGFGAPLVNAARESFSAFVLNLVADHFLDNCQFKFKKRINPSTFPPKTNLFSLVYNLDLKAWMEWEYDIDRYDICGYRLRTKEHLNTDEASDGTPRAFIADDEEDIEAVEYQNLFIVTQDTLKQMYLLEKLVGHGFPVLMLGDTGTGKTQVIKQFVARLLEDKGRWEVGEMVLSATTTANQVQEYTFNRLEKHKKGVFGPKNPSAHLVVFIDDLNMPSKEKYGAQPSLEMMRQIIDFGGFYRGKENEWHQVINQMFIAAMGLPGGGRSMPTMRLMRHFNLVHIPDLSRPTIKRIFSTILEWGMEKHAPNWRNQIKTLTEVTIDVYLKAARTLLPTPAKSHYVFNLRQVSEIIQGLLFVDATASDRQSDKPGMLKRLWVHECMRVFADRLISDEDKQLFIEECLNTKDTAFTDMSKIGKPENLLFCNFAHSPDTETVYDEVTDLSTLPHVLESIQTSYNESKGNRDRLDLLFFDYMIHHLARVSRIIMKPQGNGLLIGLSGNGRRSVSRLAIYINQCSQFQIELHKNYGLNEWQEDLRNLFKGLGIDNRKTVFMFTDKDIKEEVFFEDIDGILNVGELNNLFQSEDLEEIQYEIEKQMKKTKVKLAPMEIFKKRCKKNLHVLLFMSPAGSQLQLYFRKYPSLVNCTSIDWYLPWPDSALMAVSEQSLQDITWLINQCAIEEEIKVKMKQTLDVINEEKDGTMIEIQDKSVDSNYEQLKSMPISEKVSTIMTQIHQQALVLSQEYLSSRQKHVYITPLMFSNFQRIFQRLLERKNKAIELERGKYAQGIQKLEEAKVMIDEMQTQLERLKPVLESKRKQVDETMKRLEQETKKVEQNRDIVDKEAYEVKLQKDDADVIKVECQERLAIAEPIFQEAIRALRCLTAQDFQVIKSFNNPPSGVKLALEACCVMLGVKGQVKKDDKNNKSVDFWEVSKKQMTNWKKLIDQLENYPKENVPDDTIRKIQAYLQNPDFVPEKIKQASEAAEGICKWVIAICRFDTVYKEITPKRAALAEANEKVRVVSEQLALKQAELQMIIDKKIALEIEFKEQNTEKELLVNQRDEAQKKLNRANLLISSIGSEKDRWITTKAKLGEAKKSLLGDMILASAFITYLGPFDGKYRSRAMQAWTSCTVRHLVETSVNFTLKEAVGNDEDCTDWLIKGLPNEQVCLENMIIISESKHTQCPVLIDPQGQALKFLRQFYSSPDLTVLQLKSNQPNATQLLQHAVQEGNIVLVEGAGEVTSESMLSIVRRELSRHAGALTIKFNDNQLELHANFMCYICSQYSNPHFTPEVHQLGKVLDFSVTREGLEQQLLQIVCKAESAKEEDEREKLQKQSLKFSQDKKRLVNEILETLRLSGSNILESDDLVNQLENSKQVTSEINHKLSVARHIEERIEENRKIFKPVAEHGARLYFAVQDLPMLDPMYQFSMKWFKDLFCTCFEMDVSEAKPELEDMSALPLFEDTPGSRPAKRVTRKSIKTRDREPLKTKEMKVQRVMQLKTEFREILYRNVCMSLYESHKLLFAFFIALKIHEPTEQDKTFTEKLKALDQDSSRHFDTSSRHSDEPGSKFMKKIGQYSRKESSVKGDDLLRPIREDERTKIDQELLNFTLTGLLPRGLEIYASEPNPATDLFSDSTWKDLETLTAFDCFERLLEEICRNLPLWRGFMSCSKDTVFEALPEPYYSSLNHFAWIPLVRVLRPELTTATIRRFVLKSLGAYFVQPIIFQISEIFNESKAHTPMLLLLTQGNDPMEEITKAAQERGKVPFPISLGKGQGEKAKRIISEHKKYPTWVVLQNCHLAASFLPDLEQIIEGLQPNTKLGQDAKVKEEVVDPGFRIWLTSMSIDYFPQSILHTSIKVTNEPPKGIKASMLRQYSMINSNKSEREKYEAHSQPERWRCLFMSLCFFHAVVRERRRFGPLGWTKMYDFNDSDFRISMRQLYSMVEEFEQVPFAALQYLTGDCNYGGRVTDDRDRIALAAILKDFYSHKCYSQEDYLFAGESQARYRVFHAETLKEYLDFIRDLPDEESPELMGLHENANITQAIYDANLIFSNVLKLNQTSNEDGGNVQDCQVMAQEILAKIREPFKIKEVEALYPFSYSESMNSVLLQELARFNKLTEVIRGSLQTLLKTLEGKFVTTAEIESLKASILNNSIPEKWRNVSYQSRKPLLAYVNDLQSRLRMLDNWIQHGKPNVFWISGFFFTQSFLTGVKQNFARKFKHPIDQVDFTFRVLKFDESDQAKSCPAQEGCFLEGLFLEGASWDDRAGVLMESRHGEMHVSMPIINFIPTLLSAIDTNVHTYACPTYKTGERFGTLLTTGHSTNYVMNIQLPTEREPEHWIKRSVALLTQLDT